MRAKRRKVLVLGTFFFCLALYVLSSFVWFIEVKGNQLVSTELILAKAEEHGLKKGVHLASFKKNKIADRLLLELAQLSWVGIEAKGTKVVIEVAEKTFPSTEEENMPGNLIAREEGMIEESLVLKGTPQIQEGDKVRKGQVLILGLVYPEIIISETGEISPSGVPQIVRAKGVVRARVTRTNVEKCALQEKLIWDTGIEKGVVVLKIRDKEIYLKGTEKIPFNNYRKVRQAKPLFVYKGRNLLGPVEIISVVYKEQICEIKDWGIEGAYQEAARRTQGFLWSQLPADYKIISQSFEPISIEEKGVVAVKYILETIEDIGMYQK